MIDPAVLRPGRLDVKIRIDRPSGEAAASIVRHYLTDDLPLEQGLDADALSRVLVRDIYTRSERRHLADVRDERGTWNALFLADVVSGASLKNIVDRAKTHAVKASIASVKDVALDARCLAVRSKMSSLRLAIRCLTPIRCNGRASMVSTLDESLQSVQ